MGFIIISFEHPGHIYISHPEQAKQLPQDLINNSLEALYPQDLQYIWSFTPIKYYIKALKLIKFRKEELYLHYMINRNNTNGYEKKYNVINNVILIV